MPGCRLPCSELTQGSGSAAYLPGSCHSLWAQYTCGSREPNTLPLGSCLVGSESVKGREFSGMRPPGPGAWTHGQRQQREWPEVDGAANVKASVVLLRRLGWCRARGACEWGGSAAGPQETPRVSRGWGCRPPVVLRGGRARPEWPGVATGPGEQHSRVLRGGIAGPRAVCSLLWGTHVCRALSQGQTQSLLPALALTRQPQ